MRNSYTISKKLDVIADVEREMAAKSPNPMTKVATAYNLRICTVYLWFAQRSRLKVIALPRVRKGDKLKSVVNRPVSGVRAAKERFHLPGAGRKPMFPDIELKLFHAIQKRRCEGTRTTTAWLRGMMLAEVRKVHSSTPFKASKKWIRSFLRRYGLSVRRKTNGNHLSIQQRLPNIQQWHRNLRARLRKEGGDAKWGMYPPEQRWNVDQVPYCLGGMTTRTIDKVNAKRVWVKGKKSGNNNIQDHYNAFQVMKSASVLCKFALISANKRSNRHSPSFSVVKESAFQSGRDHSGILGSSSNSNAKRGRTTLFALITLKMSFRIS